MTFFIDTNVFAYAASSSEYAEPCRQVVAAVGTERADGRTSALALEELWHIETTRGLSELEGLTGDLHALLAPLLAVDDEAFQIALTLDAPPRLGTADRLHVGTCLAHGIDTIVTADRGFDGVRDVRRVDPLDARALKRLLG